jgi:hypothetical protein
VKGNLPLFGMSYGTTLDFLSWSCHQFNLFLGLEYIVARTVQQIVFRNIPVGIAVLPIESETKRNGQYKSI